MKTSLPNLDCLLYHDVHVRRSRHQRANRITIEGDRIACCGVKHGFALRILLGYFLGLDCGISRLALVDVSVRLNGSPRITLVGAVNV